MDRLDQFTLEDGGFCFSWIRPPAKMQPTVVLFVHLGQNLGIQQLSGSSARIKKTRVIGKKPSVCSDVIYYITIVY